MITEEQTKELFKYPKFDTITERISLGRMEYDNIFFTVMTGVFDPIKENIFDERIVECTIYNKIFYGLYICGWQQLDHPAYEIEVTFNYLDTKGLNVKCSESKINSLGTFDSVTTYWLK